MTISLRNFRARNEYIPGIFTPSKLLFVPSLIDFDVGRNSHHTLSCSVTEETPGSNLDVVILMALAIAFGVRDTGLEVKNQSLNQLINLVFDKFL